MFSTMAQFLSLTVIFQLSKWAAVIMQDVVSNLHKETAITGLLYLSSAMVSLALALIIIKNEDISKGTTIQQ